MFARRSVLIVDQSDETREVLRTALERRGMEIFEASRAEQGLELARRHRPDLIVLDMEMETGSVEGISAGFEAASDARQTPMVLLGNARRRVGAANREFVSKPYHYGPLIRRIEELLRFREQPVA
ncbi:MAG: response regulator [Pirellulales bacterium]